MTLITKPPACHGCPFFQGGAGGFVPDQMTPGATVRVVAQNPGDMEVKGSRFVGWERGGEVWDHGGASQPLIGKSGYEVTHTYLPLAGLERDEVSLSNVIRCRWQGGNELPPLTQLVVREAIRHCQRAYWQEPAPGEKLIALGAYALWALTGEEGEDKEEEGETARAATSIHGWRGWQLPYDPPHGAGAPIWAPVFATYHPAFYYRAHWLRPVGKMDWAKLGRWVRGEWPHAFPPIHEGAVSWPPVVAFDTEYNPQTGDLHRYSVAWRPAGEEPQVHVCGPDQVRRDGGGVPRVLFHNAEADWPYTEWVFGGEPEEWEDTMFAHAALYGTWRHTLDFLGSLYAPYNRWKHLEISDPIVYSGMDALATWDVWQRLQGELARDGGARRTYMEELKPLLPLLRRRPPIRLVQAKVRAGVAQLAQEQGELSDQACVAAGWPINLGSADQVARWMGVKR